MWTTNNLMIINLITYRISLYFIRDKMTACALVITTNHENIGHNKKMH